MKNHNFGKVANSSEELKFNFLCCIFFATGFSALLYQVIWQRLLSLFAGSDTISVSIVVGAFLGGLGIGSLLGSFIADRLSRHQALMSFALFNVGIALFALGSKYIFYDILFLTFPSLALSRFTTLVVSFIALLFPTTLMGLSLPVLSRAVVQGVASAARSIGLLYGLNTIGAGCGAVLGGWFLVRLVGYETALYCGLAINLAAALLVYFLFGTAAGKTRHHDIPSPTVPKKNGRMQILAGFTRHDLLWFTLVILSGFMAISLQIVFFRFFETVYGGRAFVFPVVLAHFLVFDALGALFGSRIVKKITDTRFSFCLIQGLIVVVGVGCILLFLLYGISINILSESWIGSLIVLPGAVIGPAAFLIGLYFPIVQKAVQKDTRLIGMRTGLIDCGIIIGNTLGSMATGLVLLDRYGTTGTLRILMCIGAAFLLATLTLLAARTTTIKKLQAVSLTMVLVGLLLFFPGQQNFWGLLNQKNQQLVASFYKKSHRQITETTSFVAENKTGCALVQRAKTSDDQYLSQLFYHGHLEGFVEPYIAIHILLGSIGPLIHQAPQDILLVGLGSGGTAYASGLNPATQRIDVIEIATVFFDVFGKFLDKIPHVCLQEVMSSPRFSIIGNDARRFIMGTDKKYDIIESDPLMPETSGSGMLYSVDFFRLVKTKLKKYGLFVQWAPTQRVENGIKQVFPHIIRIDTPPWRVIVASCEPLKIDIEALQNCYNSAEIKKYLAPTGVPLKDILQLLKSAKQVSLQESTHEKNVNTDLFPRDEYAQRLRDVRT